MGGFFYERRTQYLKYGDKPAGYIYHFNNTHYTLKLNKTITLRAHVKTGIKRWESWILLSKCIKQNVSFAILQLIRVQFTKYELLKLTFGIESSVHECNRHCFMNIQTKVKFFFPILRKDILCLNTDKFSIYLWAKTISILEQVK